MHLQFFGFPRKNNETVNLPPGVKDVQSKIPVQNPNSSKYKKFKWKKTNFKTCLPKHDPVVIYVTANTKNVND